MASIHAKLALLPDGWASDVRIGFNGRDIETVETGIEAGPDDERHDVLLPAMSNLHSHAFQRGMAGLAEMRGPAEDNFWSWRTVMYKFALSMNPDQMQVIAAQLYVEMLEAGFSRVGEFHYLHHDKDGRPYADIAEMAVRIVAAAEETGIGLTLLPVFYAHSNFGGLAPTDGQRRFICDLDAFGRLFEAVCRAANRLPGAVTGIAPHSLRAVTPDELAALTRLSPEGPIHIHAAEQVKEVEDCIAALQRRPVEWLLENAGVDARWCLIHATHMTAEEARGLARSGAVAGLCPVTEANLGDGFFEAETYLANAGAFGVGSDSNVLIGIRDELRQLEYAQRLARRARNIVAVPGVSTGRRLFDGAIAGGAQALGVRSGLAAGAPADMMTLDRSAAPYVGADHILDHFIFADGIRVGSVWAGGRKLVDGGRHVHREEIAARFRRVMAELLSN
ncbi:formimidoylglutamate deiminase [Ciceribacter sp. RN22]|uniref:formimidoylglutamate deiminase n=1 Tax=Ciceribacter sp. RN22 TaxID=2954932 RepID=UPI00209278F0|nr:formimidoylglutamate deiminase [Ciceribacter sp. RN22]MCO6179041.1 formimidoylglutamate deiminase [Ciceribacter sp. RN22]